MDVSVCIGTFGDKRWVELAEQRAIPSVAAQELPAREGIHVHASTLAAARNEAARQATGEYLVFLDADDELHPRYLRAMAKRENAGDLLIPSVSYRQKHRVDPPKMMEPVAYTEGNHLVIGTCHRRSLFEQVGGFRDWEFYEDWCYWMRCQMAGATLADVPGAIYVAWVKMNSRNRKPTRAQKTAMHHAIRRANCPWLYESATA